MWIWYDLFFHVTAETISCKANVLSKNAKLLLDFHLWGFAVFKSEMLLCYWSLLIVMRCRFHIPLRLFNLLHVAVFSKVTTLQPLMDLVFCSAISRNLFAREYTPLIPTTSVDSMCRRDKKHKRLPAMLLYHSDNLWAYVWLYCMLNDPKMEEWMKSLFIWTLCFQHRLEHSSKKAWIQMKALLEQESNYDAQLNSYSWTLVGINNASLTRRLEIANQPH